MKYILFLLLNTVLFSQNFSNDTQKYLEELRKKYPDSIQNYATNKIFEIGYRNAWLGFNERGEELMQYRLKNIDSMYYYDSRHSSVQNTKNGYWVRSVKKLEESSEKKPEISGYYGWVSLFFYHDYERALKHFEIYDNLTPIFIDSVNGDCILYVKALCYMKLGNYQKAISLFEESIKISNNRFGEYNYSFQTQVYKGICYSKLNNLKESLKCYDLANRVVKTADAYYYKALILKKLNKNKDAKINLQQALELIKKGTKNQDNYHEVFEEVYIQDIEKGLKE